MQLFRLVYYSTNKLESKGEALAGDLKRLLSQAIRNNKALGISGGLVFNRTNFLQVLEGNERDVRRTFDRIQHDPRHADVTIVEAAPVTAPLFDAWAMGYAGRNRTIDNLYRQLNDRGLFKPTRVSTGTLVSLVLEFVSNEEKVVSTAAERILTG